MTEATGFWLAAGHISKAAMSEASHDIGLFPRQSDQYVGRDWLRPDNDADVVEYGSLVDALDGSRHQYGGTEWKWKLRVLTPGMVKYIEDTFFSSGRSSNVTVRNYDRSTGTWTIYHAIMRYEPRESFELAGGGFDRYTVSFIDGVEATEGPDLTINKAHSGNFTQGVDGTFSILVENAGDAATHADIVVTDALPAELDLVSASGTSWTVTYSTDGTTYSGTPPDPISDTTHVRLTYTSAVAAGGAAPVISLVVNANTTGDIDNTASVTTAGDTDTDNNSDTDTVTVVAP